MSDLLNLTVISIKLKQNSLFPKNGATRYIENQRGTMSELCVTQEESGAVEDAESPRLTQNVADRCHETAFKRVFPPSTRSPVLVHAPVTSCHDYCNSPP